MSFERYKGTPKSIVNPLESDVEPDLSGFETAQVSQETTDACRRLVGAGCPSLAILQYDVARWRADSNDRLFGEEGREAWKRAIPS